MKIIEEPRRFQVQLTWKEIAKALDDYAKRELACRLGNENFVGKIEIEVSSPHREWSHTFKIHSGELDSY